MRLRAVSKIYPGQSTTTKLIRHPTIPGARPSADDPARRVADPGLLMRILCAEQDNTVPIYGTHTRRRRPSPRRCPARSHCRARRPDSAARKSLVDDLHAVREPRRGRAAHLVRGFPRYFGGVRGLFPTGWGVYRHSAPWDPKFGRCPVGQPATLYSLRSAAITDNPDTKHSSYSHCPRGTGFRATPRGDHTYEPGHILCLGSG